jgi:quercetin dioxygenase-like cupin family protein
MNQSDFEADLRRQGYEVSYGGMKAGEVNADHTHDWDARVMVIGGEITLTRAGKAETFGVGDSCAVAAGEVHAECVGAHGVAYVAGRRSAAG